MNRLEENWFKVIIIILAIVVLGFVWYWYEYRPSAIRKNCYQAALQTSDFDLNYKSCLRYNGLEK